jgi:hypothetical protein
VLRVRASPICRRRRWHGVGRQQDRKIKLAKDGTSAFTDIYEFAKAIREGSLSWEDIEKADMDTRLKWVGLLHRSKRTPGRFMMRLRTPNGIITSDLLRFYADCVEPYGDIGVVDITTRQNIQLRGVTVEDAPTIIDGLHARNQTCAWRPCEPCARRRRRLHARSLPPLARSLTTAACTLAAHAAMHSRCTLYTARSSLRSTMCATSSALRSRGSTRTRWWTRARSATRSTISSRSTPRRASAATRCGATCRASSTLP